MLSEPKKIILIPLSLQVVSEIERGELSQKGAQRKYGIQGNRTIVNWLRKCGNLNVNYQTKGRKMKSHE